MFIEYSKDRQGKWQKVIAKNYSTSKRWFPRIKKLFVIDFEGVVVDDPGDDSDNDNGDDDP